MRRRGAMGLVPAWPRVPGGHEEDRKHSGKLLAGHAWVSVSAQGGRRPPDGVRGVPTVLGRKQQTLRDSLLHSRPAGCRNVELRTAGG